MSSDLQLDALFSSAAPGGGSARSMLFQASALDAADVYLMAAAAPVCMILVDTNFRIKSFTPFAAQKVSELLQQELMKGKFILDLLPETAAAEGMMSLHAALAGSEGKFVFPLTVADQQPRYIQALLRTAKNHTGQIEGVVVTCSNITDKYLLAEARRRSRHTMLLFRSIPLPAFVFDPETLQVQAVNKKAISYYGYSEEELLSMLVTDLHQEEERESVRYQIQRNRFRKDIAILEWNHQNKDGTPLIVELWASTIKYSGRRMRLVMVNDITEKKRSEQELRESAERFNYVANATADIIWDWHQGEDTILWSDHYQHILGWQLPPLRKLPLSHSMDCLHPEDKDRVINQIDWVMAHTKDVLWENAFRYRRSDGSYAYILDKGFMIRNTEGKVVRMIGAMHDISEQQYQQELVELELRVFALSSRPGVTLPTVLKELALGLGALHGGAQACIVLFPEHGAPTMVAPGIAATAVPWLLQLATVKGAKEQQVSSQGLQTFAVTVEEGLMLSNGPEQPRQVWVAPVQPTEKGLQALIMLLEKGTREPSNQELNAWLRIKNLLHTLLLHHTSLEQIRMANERFDNVMKATHDLVWDWDLVSGSFYRSPEGLRKIYGSSYSVSSEGSAAEWLDRIHPEDLSRVQTLINQVLQNAHREKFEVEYQLRREDGTYAYLYDRGIIIRNAAGKPLRMIGAAQDITERKLLEQELLRQELERQRVISRATIDTQEQERAEIGKELHDNVNQILTTTKLYLDLAKDSPGMQTDLLTKASQNVINVINEIRQLSRSLMDPSLGDLGLADSVKDLVENINLTRKVFITLDIAENLDAYLDESKKLMVFRVLQEATNNIVRHSQATQASISLKTYRRSLVQLRVKDNGIGFNPEQVLSGIGLKNIRNRVYLVDGTLHIESGPKKGTTITIKFPIQKVQNSHG